MDHKPQPLILHELLQQDQDPFHLQTYISDKRSCLNHSSPPAAARNASSPFFDFHPPAILRVPPTTAAVLAEAATRIQKQRQPKTQMKNVGLSLFGSLFKILKYRRRIKVERNCDLEERQNPDEIIRISSSCIHHLRASSSFHDTADFEAPNCSGPISPFIFSPFKSPSFSGRRTPESCSPAATSPIRRHVIEEEENCASGVEEEKEQCSPVSVLEDTFFEDDEHGSLVGEEEDDDDDLDLYANIERARQQLLERLERFEKLAALDQVDLEEKLLEASEEIGGIEIFEHLRLCGQQDLVTSSLKQSPMKMCADMKRLTGDDECQVVFRRSRRLPRQAGFSAIDLMVKLEAWNWERWSEGVEETAEEMEVAIFEGLMEECFACID